MKAQAIGIALAVVVAVGIAWAGSSGVGAGGLTGFPQQQPVDGAAIAPSSVTSGYGVFGISDAGTVRVTAKAVFPDPADGFPIEFPGTETSKYLLAACDAKGVRIGAKCSGGSAHTLDLYATVGGNIQWSINGTSGDFEGTGDNNLTVPGTPYVTSLSGTAGSGTGYTVNTTGAIQHKVHKLTLTNAALNAAATSDETIWTVPAKTRVLRMIADYTTTFSGGGITDMDVTCGTSAGGNQYLVTHDVDTAIGTYGDVAAEIGAGLLSATVADIPSWSGTTNVQCRFTCVGANCNAATQGSVTYYIEHLVYP